MLVVSNLPYSEQCANQSEHGHYFFGNNNKLTTKCLHYFIEIQADKQGIFKAEKKQHH